MQLDILYPSSSIYSVDGTDQSIRNHKEICSLEQKSYLHYLGQCQTTTRSGTGQGHITFQLTSQQILEVNQLSFLHGTNRIKALFDKYMIYISIHLSLQLFYILYSNIVWILHSQSQLRKGKFSLSLKEADILIVRNVQRSHCSTHIQWCLT